MQSHSLLSQDESIIISRESFSMHVMRAREKLSHGGIKGESEKLAWIETRTAFSKETYKMLTMKRYQDCCNLLSYKFISIESGRKITLA